MGTLVRRIGHHSHGGVELWASDDGVPPIPAANTSVKQRPTLMGMKVAEMLDSGLSGSPVFVNSNSTDQSELAMSLGASPYRQSFEWRMGKSPGGKGRWS